MRRGMNRAATALLFLAVALLLAPTIVPPFLDRVYYRGSPSDHFDGHRFFNPEGEGRVGRRSVAAMAWAALTHRNARPWPASIPVAPGYPPPAATACPPMSGRAVGNVARCVPHPDPARMFVTWIGHSTVLVQAGGLNILTDPIWSNRAGPWNLLGPKRARAPGIRFDDLPRIDLVLVSHDHYDHMDLPTLRRLWTRDRPLVVTSLGNDTILRAAGVPARAADWGGRVSVHARPGTPPVEVIVERVHHWSSRWGSDRNRALWSGFTVVLPGGNLFFAGDTGWGDGSWPRAAARHGPFRLALLPIGAYAPRSVFGQSHIGPEEAVAAFRVLGAARAVAVHWGTFHLTGEGPNDPPRRLAASLARQGIAPDRFRALDVGRPWEIAAIGR